MASFITQQLWNPSGGIDRILPADSARWGLLVTVIAGTICWVGPLASIDLNQGCLIAAPNFDEVWTVNRVGQLIADEWWGNAVLGTQVILTEIIA